MLCDTQCKVRRVQLIFHVHAPKRLSGVTTKSQVGDWKFRATQTEQPWPKQSDRPPAAPGAYNFLISQPGCGKQMHENIWISPNDIWDKHGRKPKLGLLELFVTSAGVWGDSKGSAEAQLAGAVCSLHPLHCCSRLGRAAGRQTDRHAAQDRQTDSGKLQDAPGTHSQSLVLEKTGVKWVYSVCLQVCCCCTTPTSRALGSLSLHRQERLMERNWEQGGDSTGTSAQSLQELCDNSLICKCNCHKRCELHRQKRR